MAIINYFPGGGGAKGYFPQIIVTVDTGPVTTRPDGPTPLSGSSAVGYSF